MVRFIQRRNRANPSFEPNFIATENHDVFVWGHGILGVGPQVQFLKEPTIIPTVLFGKNEFNPDSVVTAIYRYAIDIFHKNDSHMLNCFIFYHLYIFQWKQSHGCCNEHT